MIMIINCNVELPLYVWLLRKKNYYLLHVSNCPVSVIYGLPDSLYSSGLTDESGGKTEAFNPDHKYNEPRQASFCS